jgi:carbonic anhydrase
MSDQAITKQDALKRLRDGNDRFVSRNQRLRSSADNRRLAELVDSQHPFAIILCCSDSRVPPEIIFDQGLGYLFVVRVAGNIADSTQIGSIEFAAEQFGTSLIVVLGHSNCGAVQATYDQMEDQTIDASEDFMVIVEHIKTGFESQISNENSDDREWLIRRAIQANIETSVARIRRSRIIQELEKSAKLIVIGAEYSLESGVVEFIETFQSE